MKWLALFILSAAAFAQPDTSLSQQPDRSSEGWRRPDFGYALRLSRGQEGLAPRLQMNGRGDEAVGRRPIRSASAGGLNDPKTQAVAAKSFFRSRLFLALLGGAIAGTGAALLVTGEGTRQVPASNCSFYPAPFVPCNPAHTVKTRSNIRDGLGGGMLIGGIVVVWVGIQR